MDEARVIQRLENEAGVGDRPGGGWCRFRGAIESDVGDGSGEASRRGGRGKEPVVADEVEALRAVAEPACRRVEAPVRACSAPGQTPGGRHYCSPFLRRRSSSGC